MKLSLLLKGTNIKIPVNPKIMGITDDSRKVKKGYLFVAIVGLTVDGHDYIAKAIENGAVVVIGERKLDIDSAMYLRVNDSREALGLLSANWYGNASKKLKVIGVTGTKGKTTTADMIYYILNNCGKKTGLVSTLGAYIGKFQNDTGLHVTSPNVVDLNYILSEMVTNGCKYAVIEVSSHGIHQKRIYGIKFDISVLTNIAPEHLDYHKNFSEYKKVKMSFVNSVGIKVISRNSTNINIFPGVFNNINADTAIAVCEKLGISKSRSLQILKSYQLPAGRMQEIKNNKSFYIYIDFAHTQDSIRQALIHLKSISKGRLISVFGCAGERDAQKRSKMGYVSGKIADITILTAEDPRNERVKDIIKEIEIGVKKTKIKKLSLYKFKSRYKLKKESEKQKGYLIIPERGYAIFSAINNIAEKEDVVVIFGKGHEKSMNYNGIEYPWSDIKAIEYSLKGKILKIRHE